MGLDVYLQYCEDSVAADKYENQYDQLCERIRKRIMGIKDWSQSTQEERDLYHLEVKEMTGLLDADEHIKRRTIEIPSKKYPEHYFKIGYFRSSYNGSGINYVLRDLGLLGLYEIFGVSNEHDTSPDWFQSRERAKETLKAFREMEEIPCSFFVHSIGDKNPSSTEEAIEVFKSMQATHKDSFAGFSNSKGEFYFRGLKVYAMIPGNQYNQEGVFFITKLEDDSKAYYEQALEIIIETCDYVLSQPNSNYYTMIWSG